MKIKITSDSTCDLPRPVLERYAISLVPLYVVKDGVSYRDGVDISTRDIYDHVAAGGALCSTSAVSQEDYRLFFDRSLQGYDALVHFTISSELSACYQNASLVAREFGNVYVVDSRNLSTGQGLLVLEAAAMAASGRTAAEIAAQMRASVDQVDSSFILDRLDYMRKGGRCSAVTALGANLLGIKPCIQVADGGMRVAKKYRGPYDKVLQQYVRDRLADDTIRTHRLMVTHTPVPDGILDMVREEIAQLRAFDEVIYAEAQCTIACHCGPGTLGLLSLHR